MFVLLIQYIIGIQENTKIRVDLISGAKIKIGVRIQDLIAGACTGIAQISISFANIKKIGGQEQLVPVIVSRRHVQLQRRNIPGLLNKIVFIAEGPYSDRKSTRLNSSH